ncbi:hypothetical protein AB0F88_18990 [Streptosporangium sp. NPDC023963]|uniref:hypothetical protein n=1 Tax=Streptosporangium sp. NPDC023963 TaxID=3155608 RepID=UPI003420FE14
MVTETAPFAADRIVAIGEACSRRGTTTPVSLAELQRLEHLRVLLPGAKVTAPPKLLLFSRSGFTADLAHTAARRSDVELVDLGRLYGGS